MGRPPAFSGWQGRAPELRGNKANSFYYGAVTVDGLMNLSQLIKRYHERPFDVGIIAGIGFNRSFSHASSFMGRLGLQGSTRINEALDFNVEASPTAGTAVTTTASTPTST